MRIVVHIGPEEYGAARLQSVLSDKRDQMAGKGILFPRSPGNRNHTRLYMAATDPDHVDPLRHARGFADPTRQAALRDTVMAGIAREVATHSPDLLILSAHQLGSSLHRPSEVARLHDMLAPLSRDIRILAHIDDPARTLARHYAAQVMEGRARSLDVELGLARTGGDWWDAALACAPEIAPAQGQFLETQAPPFWLDAPRLVALWETSFGQGSVVLRPLNQAIFGPAATEELRAAFGIEPTIGKAEPAAPPAQPPAAWLARARQLNAVLLRLLAQQGHTIPRPLWSRFLAELAVPGRPIDPGSLSAITARFTAHAACLRAAHPALAAAKRDAPRPAAPWTEADPTNGYRATQYLLAFLPQIQRATAEAQAERTAPDRTATPVPGPSDAALRIMPDLAVQKFGELLRSPFRPHDRLGDVDETTVAPAYPPAAPRDLAKGSTGNLIVACMKDEAPYLLEWIAHHRAVGFDSFLIYTNNCSDGTEALLSRLDTLGIVHHRDNDGWTGQSPQQHALDSAMSDPVFQNAAWVAHIDVDEFVNVRCDNGTIQDVMARVPDATGIAMTWRLFGHNGVTRFDDRFVTEQFDTCAPKFCPKPHTAWGFKTLFRNDGAYAKLSCHRPNKPDPAAMDKLAWVNGSGRPMGRDVIRNGWRSSRRTIGYDLVQLNHYALRSAEGWLIKRQRGRALHVDRSIGLNYWIRMDWGDVQDVTIQRNLPRVRAEYDRLMQDPEVARLHRAGVDWHRAKAKELRNTPEFADLYAQILEIRLSGTERVAYALALDMES